MKNIFYKITFLTVATVFVMSSCHINEIDNPVDSNFNVTSTISATCIVDNTLPELATRSLIDQVTTKAMAANFVRMDEDVKGGDGADKLDGEYTFFGGSDKTTYETVNWTRGHLLEASVIPSPDNTPDIHYRSITFDPIQSYSIIVTGDASLGTEDTTNFYHTRMVGWYPQNCTLARNVQGKAVYTLFDNSRFDGVRESPVTPSGTSRHRVGVKFTDLDGSKDLMVSNVKEAQHWHSKTRVWSKPSTAPATTHGSVPHPSDTHNGADVYRDPFGHYTTGPHYENYFTFKHYLTAVRIWAYADQSLQNLNMWGNLTNVIFTNQPHTCSIWLPEEISTEYGEVYNWADYSATSIICSKMYGDDTNHEDENFEANYPISISGAGSADDKIYLGYALVQPDRALSIELHTTNGVYLVDIPSSYTKTDLSVVDIFKAGYVYDVKLNLQTSGTIAVLLENEENKHFFDLTTLKEYKIGEQSLSSLKYANCYIVSPNDNSFKRDDGSGTLVPYDGFCFSATTIGNGQSGIISYGSQKMYPTKADITPTSARLIWESSLGLISDIELLYGYVRFKVTNPALEGNAVVGVYDDNDNILWSWHIWLTDYPQEQSCIISGINYVFLDRNLGATASTWTDASDALQTYGLYYQWGRKDPSMGPPAYNYLQRNLITAPYYDYSAEVHNAAHIKQFPQPTLKNGIENPLYLIMPMGETQTYAYNWLYDNCNLLWGYNSDNGTMTKTIYDPCPFGYRVSASELGMIFNGYSSYARTTYGQTYTVGTSVFYFPYTGYKGVDKGLNSMVGEWRYVGRKGDYQTALYSSTTGGDYLHRGRIYISASDSWEEPGVKTYSGYLHLDYANKRTSAPVRCVKNEDYGTLTTDLNMVDVFVPEDVVSIVTTALAGESSIAKVKLYVNYTLSGGEARTDVIFENNSPSCGSVWSNTRSYTFPNATFLASTTGEFEFVFRAETDLGVVSSTIHSVVLLTSSASYAGWSASLSGLGGPIVGQPGKLSVRLQANDLLDVQSVTIKGAAASSVSNSSSGNVYDVTFQTDNNVSFDTAGNIDVPVVVTLVSGTVLSYTVSVPVSAFSISAVAYSTCSPKLTGAGGPVVNQPVNLVATVTSNANSIASVTIGGVATSISSAVSGSDCVTTCTTTSTTTFTTNANATVAVVVTDNNGDTYSYNITVPVYGISQGVQTSTVDTDKYYFIKSTSTSYYVAASDASTATVQTTADYSAIYQFGSTGSPSTFKNVKYSTFVTGTHYGNLSLSGSGTSYAISVSSYNFTIKRQSGNHYWFPNTDTGRLQLRSNTSTTWNIYAVTFVAP